MQRSNLPLLLLMVAMVLVGSGCMSPGMTRIYVSPDSEMGRAIADMDAMEKAALDRKFQANARLAARRFIQSAQAGDLSAMMKMSSPLALKYNGDEVAEAILRDQVIPSFRGAMVEWDETEEPLVDAGFPGLRVMGRTTGEDSFPFSVFVFLEHGRYVVGTITRDDLEQKEP